MKPLATLTEATDCLRAACRAASVEILHYYPAADAWHVVHRGPKGRQEIECTTAEIFDRLHALATALDGSQEVTNL